MKKENEIIYSSYLRANGNLEQIILEAKKLNVNLNDFFDSLMNYINKNCSRADYAKIFDTLLLLETEEEIIDYLNSIPVDLKYLRSNLPAYFFYYRPDIYFLNPTLSESLRKKITTYYIYLRDKEKPKKLIEDKNSIAYAIYIITSFIQSKYTMKRFCFNQNLSLKDIKKFLTKVKNANPTLYNEYLLNISIKEERKEREIGNDVLKILNTIKEEGSISLIQLLQMTVYSIEELTQASDLILSLEDRKIFRKNIRKFIPFNPFIQAEINNLINNTFIFNINGEKTEITTEDKQAAILFLQERNIPISMVTFKEVILHLYPNKEIAKKHRN